MFTLKSLAVAGSLVFGALVTTSGTANAGDLRIGIHFGGPGFHLGIHDRHYHDRRYRPRRYCSPRRALRKARRRGVRGAYVHRVRNRAVVIGGWRWGERVRMGFSQHRSCPVRFVRYR